MKTAKYLRMKAASTSAVYRFTPRVYTSGYGNASSNAGLPLGYNSSVHGVCIWPAGRAGGSGWVGTKFIPSQSVINLQFACDDYSQIYLNDQLVISTNNWNVWGQAVVNVIPGRRYAISAYVVDGGALYGFAGRIYYNDGTAVTQTSTSWVSTF